MIDYGGQTCIVCNNSFTEDADVVVCPDCGTPYHRECYKQQGRCVNEVLHQSGGSWQIVKRDEQEAEKRAAHRAEMEQQAAEREREGMGDYPNAAMYDGIRMNNDPCLGLDPQEQLDGVTIREMSSFIDTNRFYYLPLFRMMKQTGRKMSFNLTCLFFPELYFANRKMWGMTLLSMLIQTVLALPSVLVMFAEYTGLPFDGLDLHGSGFTALINVTSLVDTVFTILCCFFANYLYYRFALRKIKGIKKTVTSEQALYSDLKEAGGTSAVNMILVGVIWLAIAMVLSVALFLLR